MFAIMSLPVEEPPSQMGVKLRINYNRTTSVENILLISVVLKKVMHCFVAVAFILGHPVNHRTLVYCFSDNRAKSEILQLSQKISKLVY